MINANRRAPNSSFKPLPKGADLLVAVRRSIRIGRHSGRPLEELGIAPDHRHYTTKRDLLKSNVDLIRMAARILKKKPIYSLSVKPFTRKEGSRGVTVTARSKISPGKRMENISYLNIYVNGRFFKNIDCKNGTIKARTILERSKGKSELLVQAFDGANNLVAAYRLR